MTRFVVCFLLASASVVSAQSADLRTRAEITDYDETSTYDDLQRIGQGLLATAPALVSGA